MGGLFCYYWDLFSNGFVCDLFDCHHRVALQSLVSVGFVCCLRSFCLVVSVFSDELVCNLYGCHHSVALQALFSSGFV